MTMLARLKRYNGKTHVRRTLTVFSIKFQEAQGWYRVDDDVAEYLKTIKQIENDPYSADAFDVCAEDEAAELDELEKKLEERRKADQANETQRPVRVHNATRRPASPVPSGTLTTADLPRASAPPAAKADFDAQPDTFDDDMADKTSPEMPVVVPRTPPPPPPTPPPPARVARRPGR